MIIKNFSLYGRRYYLKLELLQSSIFFMIFILCLGLSVWQWQRSESSRVIEKQQEAKQLMTVSNVSHQLALTGHWLEGNFLLDNRTHKGKAGYYHLGLFKPNNNKTALLINLGWLKSPLLRSDIPAISLPKGLQKIMITQTPLIKPVVWTSDHWPSPEGRNWPKRIQSIDTERFELATQQKIETGYWQLVTGKGKLIDIFQSSPYLNKHRHLGYALQWLLIAIAALIVGFCSNIREYKPNLRSRHEKQ